MEVTGEQQNGGEVDGGGRWLGWFWISPERARGVELNRGIDELVHERDFGKFLVAEVA